MKWLIYYRTSYSKVYSEEMSWLIFGEQNGPTNQPKPKLFNYKPRSKQEYTWNPTNILVCNRVSKSEGRASVKNEASVWFSSNELILLGEIHFADICEYSSCSIDITQNRVKLNEVGDFRNDPSPKLLYTKSYVSPRSTLTLDKPIVIHSHKMYRIQLTLQKDSAYHYYDWVKEALLDDKIKITFHRNYDRSCFVSKLHFNKIE